MKKGAITRIVVWSITAMVLTGVLVTGILFSGSSFFDSIIGDGMQIGINGYSYKNSGDYTIGGGSVSEEINEIQINWVKGSVKVEAYDGNQIEFSENGVYDEDYQMRYLVSGKKLIIQTKKAGFVFGITRSVKKDLTVKIPKSCFEKLDNLKIDVVSAKVNINGIKINSNLKYDGVSGDINITDFKALACDFNTVSGNVTAEKLIAGGISADSVSGDVKIDGEISSADFDTTSGKITLKSSTPINEIEADSISGDINIQIPENNGFTAEYDSVSGNLDCDFALKASGSKRIYGDGNAKFEFDTTSGDVTIKSF